MTVTSATGQQGHILRTGDSWVFRVYDSALNFVDYSIAHTDLWVQIMDEDAAFYSCEGVHVLDHAPTTLGLD